MNTATLASLVLLGVGTVNLLVDLPTLAGNLLAKAKSVVTPTPTPKDSSLAAVNALWLVRETIDLTDPANAKAIDTLLLAISNGPLSPVAPQPAPPVVTPTPGPSEP